MFKILIAASAPLTIFVLMVTATFSLAVKTYVKFNENNETVYKYELNKRVETAITIFYRCDFTPK